MYCIYKEKNSYYLHPDVKLSEAGDKNGSFGGYYDKSTEKNGNYLFHVFKGKISPHKCPLIDISLNQIVYSHTNTWNWQQGAMTSWLNDKEFIHNFFDKDKFRSKIININTRQEKFLDYPIYKVSHNGNFALSLNFNRLALLRPDYGYFNNFFQKISKSSAEDGIFYVDLINNTCKLIISLEQLAAFHSRKEMKNAFHKVNHIDISPNDKRIMFLHRWINERGQKWSRLITADTDGNNMYLLADDDMVSHCTWRSDTEIVGWMRKHTLGDRYLLLHDQSEDFSVIGEGILTQDGHPGFSKDGRWMLTDSYPDKSRLSGLILYDTLKKRKYELGRFYSSMHYVGENRCDLHPRFNNSSDNIITFDSVHTGVRVMYQMDISKIINQ